MSKPTKGAEVDKDLLATNLQKLKDHKGLTNKGLGDLLNVSLDTIKSWKCGRIGISQENLDNLKAVYSLEGMVW